MRSMTSRVWPHRISSPACGAPIRKKAFSPETPNRAPSRRPWVGPRSTQALESAATCPALDRHPRHLPSPGWAAWCLRLTACPLLSGLAASAPWSGGAIDGLASDAPVAVVQLVSAAREQSIELKQKAETPAEKATIEVVALMFQSILSEERIPVAVRIWFARLQVPVLRVALAEPDFFSNLDHPARKLIDRMGACAMGFNSTAIDGSALEAQVRRAVQMIEQYPETGSRVF